MTIEQIEKLSDEELLHSYTAVFGSQYIVGVNSTRIKELESIELKISAEILKRMKK